MSVRESPDEMVDVMALPLIVVGQFAVSFQLFVVRCQRFDVVTPARMGGPDEVCQHVWVAWV